MKSVRCVVGVMIVNYVTRYMELPTNSLEAVLHAVQSELRKRQDLARIIMLYENNLLVAETPTELN